MKVSLVKLVSSCDAPCQGAIAYGHIDKSHRKISTKLNRVGTNFNKVWGPVGDC